MVWGKEVGVSFHKDTTPNPVMNPSEPDKAVPPPYSSPLPFQTEAMHDIIHATHYIDLIHVPILPIRWKKKRIPNDGPLTIFE